MKISEIEFEEGKEYILDPLFYLVLSPELGGGVCMYVKHNDTPYKWTTNDETILNNMYKFADLFWGMEKKKCFSLLSVTFSKGFYKIRKTIGEDLVSLDINTKYIYHDKNSYKLQINKDPRTGKTLSLYSTKEKLDWDILNNILQYHFTNGLDTDYIVKGASGRKTTNPFYTGKRKILEKYGLEPELLFEKLDEYIDGFKKGTKCENTMDMSLEEWIEMGTREGHIDIFKKELMEDILNELHK